MELTDILRCPKTGNKLRLYDEDSIVYVEHSDVPVGTGLFTCSLYAGFPLNKVYRLGTWVTYLINAEITRLHRLGVSKVAYFLRGRFDPLFHLKAHYTRKKVLPMSPVYTPFKGE